MKYADFVALGIAEDNGVVTVTLNRPDSFNAFDDTLHEEFEAIWPMISRDDEVRAVVITGAGRAFCAGGNLKGMAERIQDPKTNLRHTLKVPASALRLLESMLNLPQPLIAAVNGDAIGLGATIALAADISVISETAKFGDTHVRAGIVAGDGGAVLWPMLVGPNRAKDFLMRGRIVNGVEAERLGLINYVAAPSEVNAKASALARELADGPPWPIRWTKLSVNKQIKQQINLIFDASIALEALTMLTEDHAAAVDGFINKRRPTFHGR